MTKPDRLHGALIPSDQKDQCGFANQAVHRSSVDRPDGQGCFVAFFLHRVLPDEGLDFEGPLLQVDVAGVHGGVEHVFSARREGRSRCACSAWPGPTACSPAPHRPPSACPPHCRSGRSPMLRSLLTPSHTLPVPSKLPAKPASIGHSFRLKASSVQFGYHW